MTRHLFNTVFKLQLSSDAVDIVRALYIEPVIQICDDACGVARNKLLSFEDAKSTLGEARKGCIAIPDPAIVPSNGMVSIPSLIPNQKPGVKVDVTTNIHPDTGVKIFCLFITNLKYNLNRHAVKNNLGISAFCCPYPLQYIDM